MVKKVTPPFSKSCSWFFFSSTELLCSVCHSSFLSVLCKPLFQCKMDLNGTRSEHSENSYKWPLIQASDSGLTSCFSCCCCSYEGACKQDCVLKNRFLSASFFLWACQFSFWNPSLSLLWFGWGFFSPRSLQWFICELQKLWSPALNCLLPVLSPQ